MTSWIDSRFGTWRGAVRLALSHPQHWLSIGRKEPADPAMIRRLVFVCRGNISRSAYADRLAKQNGLDSASFGLLSDGGVCADPVAAKLGEQRGLNMAAHLSSGVKAYEPETGDLLLAMEVRQLKQLARNPKTAPLPRLLLGSFAGTPHLHDPFTLSPEYYESCFDRIERAVDQLAIRYPGAKLSE